MLKRKVFIMAYARANVGDDLFIISLLERYKDIHFYIGIKKREYAKAFEKYCNLTMIENNQENFDNKIPEDYDAYIYVGGSIFMEGGKVYNLDNGCNLFMKKCYEKNIPFFYISSNFGPYQTQEYFDLARDTFKYCTDICFRDKYSYELFKDIPTVRYAPDLIFRLKDENIFIKKDTVGISIIDMSIREKLIQYEEKYIKCMVHNIIQYIKQGKTVYLFSFCKEENDEKAIEKIQRQIPEEYKKSIKNIYYNGNIEEYIEIYKSMEYMICCRFHAKILSVALGQKMYILSYSKKIDNVIQDLNLTEEYTNIENLTEDMNIDLEKFKAVEKDKIIKIRELSQGQLEKIDKWYKENG
ncbi:MAG: polysaccharide pyruvyl transferase family protein [Clostridia bacterium]|nr:polysaccharide pyruvyl transferase family protein [Clostridia bacterium]